MKKENFENNQNEFIQVEKSYPAKQEEYPINNKNAKNLSDDENAEHIENDNHMHLDIQLPEYLKKKSLSDSNKFENFESEYSKSSEPKRSVNSIELIVESGKSRKFKTNQNKDKNEYSIFPNSFLDNFHLRTLILITVFLNIFAGFYIFCNKKKIKQIGIAVGIFFAIVILEWIGLAFAIYYSVSKH